MILSQESTAEFLKAEYSNLINNNAGLLLNNFKFKYGVETRFE